MAYYEKMRDRINGFFIKTGEMTFPEHFHRSIELICCLGADIDVCINGTNKKLTENTFAFIDSYDVHSLAGYNTQCYNMIIPEKFTANYANYKNGRILNNNYIYDRDFVKKITPLFLSVVSFTDNPLAFTGAIDLLLATLAQKIGFTETVAPEKSIAYEITKLLETHYAEKIDLNFLARKLGYHKCYISQIISTHFNDNFKNLLNSVRYKKFTELQRQNDNLLNNIFCAGFNSVSTFYRYCSLKNLPTKFDNDFPKKIPTSCN